MVHNDSTTILLKKLDLLLSMSYFLDRRSNPLPELVPRVIPTFQRDSIHYSNQIKYERPKMDSIRLVSEKASMMINSNLSLNSPKRNNQRKTLEMFKRKDNKLAESERVGTQFMVPIFVCEPTKILHTSISSIKKSVASTGWRTNSDGKSDDVKPILSTKSLQIQPKKQKYSTDFQVLKQIGQGKFSKVSLVRHRETGFIAAMKTLSKKNITDDSLVNQLLREVKILSFINHPNIVSLYGVYNDSQNIYLVEEMGCDGELYSILCKRKTFSEQAVSFIIRSLLVAVSYLHSHKILHRDIKPQNVVIIHGIVKLCDLGWSVHTRSKFRETLCGTPLYSSPQLIQGGKYNQKIDLWALGIMAFELKFGKAPFKISNKTQLYKIITDEIDFSQGKVSQQFQHFVKSLLHKDPKQRLTAEMMLKHPFILQYQQFQTCQELCFQQNTDN